LKAHLKICKKNPHKPVVDNQGTLQLQPSPDNSSLGTLSTWKFDPEELRRSFAEMIIEDEQPFVCYMNILALESLCQKHAHILFCHLEEQSLDPV
jgi:hypothetical protein